jgi:hypothetical protein
MNSMLTKRLLIITATALAYFWFNRLNEFFFDQLKYSYSVHWVYLPSGLKMALILVFIVNGALGVALASTLFTYLLPDFDGNYLSLTVTGLIMGLVPLWTRYIAVDWLNLDSELKNLNTTKLLQLSILFAVIPPVVQQLWFFHTEMTENFLMSTVVMMIGDWVGIVIFLYLIKLALPVLRSLGLLDSNYDYSDDMKAIRF